ncbi:MAG: DUF2071 domain-containing protein [Bacteroidota bacterium]
MLGLKNHPFAVEAFFRRSLVLTFALPKEDLVERIPPCLELDCLDNQWAFLAVAMVDTKDLRPKGFPKIFGRDFFLVGYRIFVKYQDGKGRSLRGLYILKSETNSTVMELIGNIFTHYGYSTTDIVQEEMTPQLTVQSKKSNFNIVVDLMKKEELPLPAQTPFRNWKQARRFAGPMPYTFNFMEEERKVLIVKGVRRGWKPRPVYLNSQKFGFLEGMHLQHAQAASVFVIENVPYYWEKGKLEAWSGK